jgi:hypothetical protein
LAKNPSRRVVYLPDQDLPDPEKHKIVDGKIVPMSHQEIAGMRQKKKDNQDAALVNHLRGIILQVLKEKGVV